MELAAEQIENLYGRPIQQANGDWLWRVHLAVQDVPESEREMAGKSWEETAEWRECTINLSAMPPRLWFRAEGFPHNAEVTKLDFSEDESMYVLMPYDVFDRLYCETVLSEPEAEEDEIP